ncbi:MAG: phosphodiester glycosidase family protein, partial [bacterium]
MNRVILLILTCLLIHYSIFAQVEFNIIYTTQVGPGVLHKKVLAPSIPWELDVLEIDLTNPYISIESVKANNLLIGREGTSRMAARNNYAEHRVVGAINGDFFSIEGVPVNAQVINGELLKQEDNDAQNPVHWSTIGFDNKNHTVITTNIFSSHLFIGNQTRKILNVNKARAPKQLILYNSYFGNSTGTNSRGTEVLIAPINDWLANDTVKCIVENIEQGLGNMAITRGKAVLSGSGQDSTFLAENIQIRDTVKMYIGLKPSIVKLKNLVGGFPRIVKDGANYAIEGYQQEGGSTTFHTDRHPRTAAGFSADSTKLYFVTVDGRQSHSKGMNLIELADFMVSIGVAQGLNLDGGGSTTMVVRDVIKNSPSDGSERSVANALLAISSAPDGELSHVQIEPDNYVFRMTDNIQFNASGWDQYYNPIKLNQSLVQFKVDSALGNITENGLFLATANGGSGYVYTMY